MTQPPSEAEVWSALAGWAEKVESIHRITSGHINATFRLEGPDGPFIFQSVAPIFPPEVNQDLDAVTRHLSARAESTVQLLPASGGELWRRHRGRVWRMLSFVPGTCVTEVTGAPMAREAGRSLGAFHRALLDFELPFKARRLGVHDTKAHLERLDFALIQNRDHALFRAVEPIGRTILDRSHHLPALPSTPERVVHGDPKISNLLFRPVEPPKAAAWVDLDTVTRMTLPLEVGDAFRSWCVQAPEDGSPTFDVQLLEAAAEGYAEGSQGFVTPAEQEALVDGAAVISLELAARFCRDALEESYFGWDSERFSRSGAHQLARARGQLALHHSLMEVLEPARATVAAAFRAR